MKKLLGLLLIAGNLHQAIAGCPNLFSTNNWFGRSFNKLAAKGGSDGAMHYVSRFLKIEKLADFYDWPQFQTSLRAFFADDDDILRKYVNTALVQPTPQYYEALGRKSFFETIPLQCNEGSYDLELAKQMALKKAKEVITEEGSSATDAIAAYKKGVDSLVSFLTEWNKRADVLASKTKTAEFIRTTSPYYWFLAYGALQQGVDPAIQALNRMSFEFFSVLLEELAPDLHRAFVAESKKILLPLS